MKRIRMIAKGDTRSLDYSSHVSDLSQGAQKCSPTSPRYVGTPSRCAKLMQEL